MVDVSFISLGLVLGPIAGCFGPAGGPLVPLVKPQFEAGRAALDKGVVRDPAVHLEVLRAVVAQARALGLAAVDAIASPILGPEGQPRVPAPSRGPARPRRRRRKLGRREPGRPAQRRPAGRGRGAMTPVRRIGFAYNPTNEAADELRDRAEGWCGVRGLDHWSAPSGELERLVAELPSTDVLVVLGGDGTFLRAARAVAEVDVPLLGVNLGKVGFLSKVEADGLEAILAQIAAGQFTVDERMTLRGVIRPRRANRQPRFFALNDVVVARAPWPGSSGWTWPSARATWRRSSPTDWSWPAPPARPAIRSRPAGRSSTRSAGTSWSPRSPATCRPSARSSSARARP